MPESVSARGIPDKFPAGLRVLLVEDNRTSLLILEKMLKQFNYEVTTCNGAEACLSLVRENKNGYDIVLTEVHMPEMDGFKLLEQVGLETDLPVIMMSADDSNSIVMKSVTHGACDYFIKPVRVEALRNIWQHVVRRRKNEWKDFESLTSAADGAQLQVDYKSSAKKRRVVWSIELHRQFVAAINQLGIDEALPEKILELMNVPNLTREHVAKHLQCYRTYLRRFSMSQGSIDTPFKVIPDAGYNLKPPSCD